MDYKVSLYSPSTVELGGQKYTLRKLNKGMYRVLEDYRKADKAAKDELERIELLYGTLPKFIDAPQDVLDDLSQGELRQLMNIINEAVFEEGRKTTAEVPAEEQAEKNGPRPGEEPAV